MAEYEFIREIFNQCSGNQMRDVDLQEIETDDVDAFMDRYRTGKNCEEERYVQEDGTIVYELTVDGLRQRFGFTEI